MADELAVASAKLLLSMTIDHEQVESEQSNEEERGQVLWKHCSDSLLCQQVFDDLSRLCLHVLSKGNDDCLEKLVLSSILPRLLQFNNGHLELEIMTVITTNLQMDDEDEVFLSKDHDSRYLLVLCSMANIVCKSEEELLRQFFLNTNCLWRLLMRGLLHTDHLCKKRSLYMLKRLLLDVTWTQEGESTTTGLLFNGQRQLWQNFFLLVEVSEEKQVHLVKQVLGLVGKLSASLHPLWLLTVYTLLFRHQNLAIVKWALVSFLGSSNQPFSKAFLSSSLLPALNNAKLFDGDGGGVVATSLIHYMEINVKHDDDLFLDCLLVSAFGMSWSPIPMMHLFRSVALTVEEECGKKNLLKKSTLVSLKDFVSTKMTCQEPLIKGAAQCHLLETLFKVSQPNQVSDDMLEVVAFIKEFHGPKKVLVRGTAMWTGLCQWISKSVDLNSMDYLKVVHQTQRKTTSCAEEQKRFAEQLALLFVLECDIRGKPGTFMDQPLPKALLANILDSIYRLYGPGITLDLVVIGEIITVLSSPLRRKGKDFLHYSQEIKQVDAKEVGLQGHSKIDDIATATVHNIVTVTDPDELLFLADSKLALLNHFEQTPNMIKDVFKVHFESKCIVSKMAAMMFLSNCSALSACDIIEEAIIEKLPLLAPKNNNIGIDPKSWNALATKYVTHQWTVVGKMLLQGKNHISRLVNIAIDGLHSGSSKSLTAMLKVCLCVVLVEKWSPDLEQQVLVLMHAAKVAVFELHKNEEFWAALEQFLKLATHKRLLQDANYEHKFFMGLVSELFCLSQSICGIGTLFMSIIEPDACSDQVLIHYLTEALLYGPIYRKDQRLVKATNKFVSSTPNLSINATEGSDHWNDAKVRSIAMVHLMKRLADRQDFNAVLLMDNLETKIGGGNQDRRHFDNSLTHLTRNRLCQTYLLMSEHTTSGGTTVSEKMCGIALNNLEAKSQQLSVKYLSEWILIRLAANDDKVKSKIYSAYENAARDKLGSVPSYLIIITQLAGFNSDLSQKASALAIVAPWCLGQQFSTRLCASACFKNLYSQCDENTQEKYSTMHGCIVDSLTNQGCYKKNREKANCDFHINDFHAWNDFNCRSIFYDHPRLTGVSRSEWIPEDVCKKVGLTSWLALNDNKSALHAHREEFCRCEQCFGNQDKNKNLIEIDNSGDHVQRKIIPWNAMFEEDCTEKKTPKNPNLILVASLIDRLPNLGGLCRTCEIFGVGTYVVGCEKYCHEKEFQNVSVTAHNWVPIEEVRPENLPEYLATKKAQGYTIVGIEQTSQSVSLEKHTFPLKTVLLLGNEKEGIPVDLIQLVDVCVEIPQTGLIRSLNVHVTGALVIWEYVRQSLISS